ALIQNDRDPRHLVNLVRIWQYDELWHTWNTVRGGIVLAARAIRPILDELSRPGLVRHLARRRQPDREILQRPGARHPDTREVGMAIGRFWRRCGEIGLAVGGPRQPWRRHAEPLGREGRGRQKQEHDVVQTLHYFSLARAPLKMFGTA